MSEVKKITLDEIYSAMDDVCMPIAEVDWNGLELVIRRNISFNEMLEFVKYVTDLCFAEDTNEYLPEVRDIAIKIFLLERYTNLEMPEEISKKTEIIYETDIIQTVLSNINPYQLNEIIRAIDTKLEYISNANIEAVNKRIEELCASFENLESSLSNVFSGVTDESMVDLVNAIKDGKLDESKLVGAYFENKGKEGLKNTEGD